MEEDLHLGHDQQTFGVIDTIDTIGTVDVVGMVGTVDVPD
jgi:hypothetical protein